MSSSRLLWRQWAACGLVVLLTIAVLGEVATGAVRDDLIEGEQDRLRTAAEVLAASAVEWFQDPEETSGPTSDDRLRVLAGASGVRLSLLAASGELIADTDSRAVRSSREGSRTEVLEARGGGEGRDVRQSLTTGAVTAFFAVRIPRLGELSGFARAGIDRGPLEARVRSVRWSFLLAAIAALVLIVAFAFAQSRQVGRSARKLTEAAEGMARGGHEPPALPGDGGWFDELALALGRVAAGNRERMDTMATDRNKVLAILGVMVEGVVAIDATGRIVHMNASAARILGTQSANTEGRRVLEVTRVSEVHHILENVLHTGREERAELRVVQPPRDRHVDLHATPLHDVDGDVVGAVLMLHDVTDLRRLEAIRRDFVANVSHELKTPITAIRGMVETVLDDERMEPEVRQRFLSRVREQSFRLSSLVTDLLTLSRLESEGLIGERTPLDLRSPVRDSVQALAQLAESKHIEIHVDAPAQPVAVLGELESLRLVIVNLLDNAVKYTPDRGNVWLRLRAEGLHAVFEVTDDGIGIERKHLDRIFQRFYRVDKARSRELGGTGLGLSIVKHVCIAHGGDITVESAPGEGSTFRVRLPLA